MGKLDYLHCEPQRVEVTHGGFPILGLVCVFLSIVTAVIFYFVNQHIESELWQKGLQALVPIVIFTAAVYSSISDVLKANAVERKIEIDSILWGVRIKKQVAFFDELEFVRYRTDIKEKPITVDPSKRVLRFIGPNKNLAMSVPDEQRMWADEGEFTSLIFESHIDNLEMYFHVLPGLKLGIHIAHMTKLPFHLHLAQYQGFPEFCKEITDAVSNASSPDSAFEDVYQIVKRTINEMGIRG